MAYLKTKVSKHHKFDEIIYLLSKNFWAKGYLFNIEDNDEHLDLLTVYLFPESIDSIYHRINFDDIEYKKLSLNKYTNIDLLLFQIINSEELNTNKIINKFIQLNSHAHFLSAKIEYFSRNEFTLQMDFLLDPKIEI